jgi:hypothetical protein
MLRLGALGLQSHTTQWDSERKYASEQMVRGYLRIWVLRCDPVSPVFYFYLYTYALDALRDYLFLDDRGLDTEARLFYFYPISYLTFSIGILLLTISRLPSVVHFSV